MGVLVGTRSGMFDLDGGTWLAGREITALATDDEGSWVLADGHELMRIAGDAEEAAAKLGDEVGRCLCPVAGGVLIGTANARLAFAGEGGVELIGSFDRVEGREAWYTPWGGPPDTRSLSAGSDGVLFANVHVGGILRATSPDGAWEPTIDIDTDVHQVTVDPIDAAHVVAATARGLAESLDAGAAWTFTTEGLHAPYARAVALDGGHLFMSASMGPRGGGAALYRREPGAAGFVRCTDGLPDWFDRNIDSHALAAVGGTAVFGTEDGRVFVSEDDGMTWRVRMDAMPAVTCVDVVPD
jgi:hypothetical protein